MANYVYIAYICIISLRPYIGILYSICISLSILLYPPTHYNVLVRSMQSDSIIILHTYYIATSLNPYYSVMFTVQYIIHVTWYLHQSGPV